MLVFLVAPQSSAPELLPFPWNKQHRLLGDTGNHQCILECVYLRETKCLPYLLAQIKVQASCLGQTTGVWFAGWKGMKG